MRRGHDPSWRARSGAPSHPCRRPLLTEPPPHEIDDSISEGPDEPRPPPHTGEQREKPQPANQEVDDKPRPLIPGRVPAHHLQEIASAVIDPERRPVALIGHRVVNQRGRNEEDLEPGPPHPEREVEVLAIHEELWIERP